MLIQSIGIVLVFAIGVALMMSRKVSAILVMPVMAVLFALIAGVPFISSTADFTIADNVLQTGAARMSSAMLTAMFGAWFGRVLNKVGVTNSIIKKAAEFAGDKPMFIALAFLAVSTIMLSASNSIGMVIMIGTIILPIMLSAGISPSISCLILIFANAIGVNFFTGNWAIYQNAMGLSLEEISNYSVLVAAPLAIVAVIFIVLNISKEQKVSRAWAMTTDFSEMKEVRTIALLSPLVPMFLVFAFKLSTIAALIIGIIVAVLLSTPKKPLQVLQSTMIEGLQDSAGVIALLIGIGMLLVSSMSEPVAAVIQPLIQFIIPNSKLMYVIMFTILVPFAIYRGPFNVYGLGSGIAALMIAGGMNPVAAMIALRVEGNVSSVCDPTNSHNVWSSEFTKIDVNILTRKSIGWLFVTVLITLGIASFMVTI